MKSLGDKRRTALKHVFTKQCSHVTVLLFSKHKISSYFKAVSRYKSNSSLNMTSFEGRFEAP